MPAAIRGAGAERGSSAPLCGKPVAFRPMPELPPQHARLSERRKGCDEFVVGAALVAARRATTRVAPTAPPRHLSCLARARLRGGPALLIFCFLWPFGVCAEEAVEHPFIEAKDIKPATCLTCHPEKNEGRFVHAAVRMGCASCHQIISEKNQTTITLFATGGNLCAKCHEPRRDPVLHGPYKNGQCLICHDPHSSEFKGETRCDVNSLCLACHMSKSATGNTAGNFDLERIAKADLGAIPRIELDPTLRFGHPRPTHPVAEVADPLNGGEKLSCLSCHTPHASTVPNLLVSPKGNGNLCDACHQGIDSQRESKPNNQAQQHP